MTVYTQAKAVTGPHVLPLSRAGRWVRRIAAVLVALLGALDMTFAAARHIGSGRMAAFRPEYSPSLIVGMRYLLLIAGIVCLLNVRPLLHGKRAAWVMTAIAAGCSIFGHRVGLGHMIGLALSGIVVALLVLFRSVFVARSDPRLFRRGWAVLLGGEVLVLAYAIIGLYLLDPEFREPVGPWDSITDGLRLLFLFPSTVDPVTPHGRFFAESVRMAALGVALVGAGRLLAPVTGTPGQDRDRQDVRALLTDHATTALAHFQLLDDKSWVFSADRRAFVGYTVVGTTAVALGEPIGHSDARTGAARAFLEHCALSGWTAAFHQVTPAGLEHVRAAGARTLTIGEEAVIDLATWTTDGRRNKSLRSALRRVERAGHRVVELPSPLSDADLLRLREVSDAWLASDGHRERGFTVGQFDAEQLRETTILAVVDAQDRIQAFANILPAYRSMEGTFDLMRRTPSSANGVMEFLFVALIERFRAEGRRGMNLGLAPFSGEGDPTVPGRVTSLIYERAGGMFNFVGLRAFKEKWSPRWEPRYLAYASDADLPKVAVAVMRAGELRDPRKPISKVMRALLRYPFTVAMFGLQLWISVVTMSHPEVHSQLVHHFG
ncbi:MAG: bifunctional lysylphosphatidylglycerol flippase/synthetase MprF, partial [Terriglobales bacterium]